MQLQSSKRQLPNFRVPFITIRLKLLLVFTLLFTILYLGIFYWFYQFATEKAWERIDEDLTVLLKSTAARIDAEDFAALVNEGEIRSDGYTDDPRYWEVAKFLHDKGEDEPRAGFYTFVRGRDEHEIIFIHSSWALNDPPDGVTFKMACTDHSDVCNSLVDNYRALNGELSIQPGIIQDSYGAWHSGYYPIRAKDGTVVGAVGIDYRADYVLKVQQSVSNGILIATLLSAVICFALAWWVSGVFTQPIRALTDVVEKVGEGDYQQDFSSLKRKRVPDEIDLLTQVFQRMVSQVKHREEEAYELQSKAEEANKLKTEFLAITSHELRTPLNSIIGFTECLLNGFGVAGPSLSDDQRYLLDRVRNNSKRLLGNINDLLDMSQLEAGRVELVNAAFSPRELIEKAVADISSQAVAKELPIRLEIATEMPEEIVGDEYLVSKILVNLLANAIKFTQSGEVEVRAEVTNADQWAFSVRDTGIGIPLDRQEVIFERFRQVDGSTQRVYGGTGLGLAIARDHARLMGGRIDVDSKPGVGSTFTVTLPLVAAKASEILVSVRAS